MHRIPTALAALLLFTACDNDKTAPPAEDPMTDGGSGDGSDGEAGPSPDIVCPEACANLARCRGEELPTDKEACSAQCLKELSGEGFLARDVAEIVFQTLMPSLDAECLPPSLDRDCAAKSVEQKCGVLSATRAGWGFNAFPPRPDHHGGEIYDRLESKPKLIKCAQTRATVCGADPEALDECLDRLYRYRPSTVALIEPCLERTYEGVGKCTALGTCMRNSNDVKGQAWLGPDFVPDAGE